MPLNKHSNRYISIRNKSLFITLLFSINIMYASSIISNKNIFDIALSSGSYKYKESNHMKIYGISYNLDLNYIYTFDNQFQFIFQSSLGAIPKAKYDGHNSLHEPVKISGEQNYYGIISTRVGYILNFYSNIKFIPFIGIGYQYLNNSNKPEFYNKHVRQQTYIYLPVGTNISCSNHTNWIIQFNLEINPLLYGQQKSIITSRQTGISETFKFNQNIGFGLNSSILFGKVYDKWGWLIGPYIKCWNIKQSDAGGIDDRTGKNIVEPDNTTIDFGLKLKFIF